MNKFVAIAIWAVVPVCLFGQAFRTDPNPTLTVGYAPPTAYPPVLAIPGAAIALCSDVNCTTRTTTYTSSAATSTCPASAQVVLAGTSSCVANSDSRGNFGFWVASGTYYYTITVSGRQYGPYPLSVGGNGGGGGGNVSGSGVAGFSARWTSSSTIASGSIQDAGNGAIGVGAPPDQILTLNSASSAGTVLHIVNTNAAGFGAVRFKNDTGTDIFSFGLNGSSGGGNPQMTFTQPLSIFPGGVDTIWINPSGTADQFRIYGTGGFNVGSTAPLATPGSGYGRLWFDSTNLTFQAKNVTGTLSTMVFPQTCASSTVVNGVNANGTLSCISGGVSVVTSVGLALPGGVFSITGSPVTSAGTLTGTFINQTANTGFMGPSSGSPGTPGFRALVLADLPPIASTNLTDSFTLARTNSPNNFTSANNFTNATIALPLSAGFTASSTRNIGIDATTPNVHLWAASADSIVATIPSAPTNTHCASWAVSAGVVQLADAGAACGSGGGGGAGNFPTGTISSSSLTMFANCITSGFPCNLSRGQGTIDQVSATNVSPSPGSGSDWIYVYWTTSGCVVGSNSGIDILTTGSGPCAGHSTQGIVGFPGNATAIVLKAHYSTAVWDQVINENPIVSNAPALVQSTGIIINQDGQHATFSVDSSVVPSYSSSAQNFVPHWDSSAHNLVDGLIQDDGTGVGIGGAHHSGDILSITENQAAFTQTSFYNTNAGGGNALAWFNDGANAAGIAFGGSTSSQPNTFQFFNDAGKVTFTANGNIVMQTETSPGSPHIKASFLNSGGMQLLFDNLSAYGACGGGNAGTIAAVQDSNTATWGATITGGAGDHVLAFCDGINWTVIGL